MSAAKGPDHKRLTRIWRGMFERCGNPKTDSYPRYGGRGIAVCDEWRELEAFKAWALANGYAPHLTLDRRDVDGHYEPDNCRWATKLQQNQNRRGVALAPDGTAWCVIAKRNGLSQTAYNNRVALGWSPEVAATTLGLYHPITPEAAALCRSALAALEEAAADVGRVDPRSAATLTKIIRQVEGWQKVRTPYLNDDGKVSLSPQSPTPERSSRSGEGND